MTLSIVKLINYSPNPEKIIAIAAKMCYSDKNIDEIIKSLTKSQINKSVKSIINSKHESVIEHTSFTFFIGNISRACMAQLTRHRMASFSVKSQRYVKEDNFKYIIPATIGSDNESKIIFTNMMKLIQNNYNKLLFNKNIDKEDSRYLLPNSCTTQLIMTMNARSLMNFFRLRCCYRAQEEIRLVANKMMKECKNVAPLLFKHAGPDCKNCTEKNKPERCVI